MRNIIRSFTAKKLEVMAYAEAHNISAAARVFDVDRKGVREWHKQKKIVSHTKEH